MSEVELEVLSSSKDKPKDGLSVHRWVKIEPVELAGDYKARIAGMDVSLLTYSLVYLF